MHCLQEWLWSVGFESTESIWEHETDNRGIGLKVHLLRPSAAEVTQEATWPKYVYSTCMYVHTALNLLLYSTSGFMLDLLHNCVCMHYAKAKHSEQCVHSVLVVGRRCSLHLTPMYVDRHMLTGPHSHCWQSKGLQTALTCAQWTVHETAARTASTQADREI